MSDDAKNRGTSEATYVGEKATLVERLRDAAERADWREVDAVRGELEERIDAERDRGWNAAMTVAGTVCREVAKKHGPHYGGSIAEHCAKLIAEYRLENPRTNSATEVDGDAADPEGDAMNESKWVAPDDAPLPTDFCNTCEDSRAFVERWGYRCIHGSGHSWRRPTPAPTADTSRWTKYADIFECRKCGKTPGCCECDRPSDAPETEEQRFLIERTCDVTPGLAVAIDAHREAALARQANGDELAAVCKERDRARRDRDYWRAEAEKARSTSGGRI